MPRVKKAVTKKKVVAKKKTTGRRGRPSAKAVAVKLDPAKNATFKAAATRREKALKICERADAAVQKASDALVAARAKARLTGTVAAKNAVLRKKDALDAAKAGAMEARKELKMADGMIAALVKFDAAQAKAYDRALAKAVKAQEKKEAMAGKKRAAPKKRRVTRKKATGATIAAAE